MATLTRIISPIVDPQTQVRKFLDIDAVITQTIVDSQTVSKFPVELGFSVSDHTFKQNKRITLTGVVSQATLKEDQQSVVISGLDQSIKEESDIPTRNVLTVLGNELRNKVPDNIFTRNTLNQKVVTRKDVTHDPLAANKDIITNATTFLEKLFNDSTLITLDTIQEDFGNLIITSLNFDKKKPEKGVLNFTMILEQIRVVETQNITVDANSLNFSTEKTREVFEATASSARVLGLSAADTNGIMRAMTQILSKGTVQSEELRGQLGERLPGAVGLMAKAIGVSVVELNKMLENGEVISKDVLPKMADAMIKFAKANGALDKAVNSNLANQERLANAWFFFKAGIAESGFMDTMTNVFTDFAKILGGNSKAATTIGIIFTGLARVFKSVGNVIGNIVIAISEMSTGFKVALAALIFLLIPFSTWALAIVTVIGFLEELFALLRGEDNLITNFIENADFLAIALAGVSAAILGILALGRLSLMFTGMTTAAAGVSSLTRGLVLLRGALTLIGKHPVFLALTAIAAVVTAIAAASNFEGDTESASIKAGLARGLRRREPDQDLAPSGFKGRGSAETTLRIELSDDLKGNITDIQSNQPTTLPESQ